MTAGSLDVLVTGAVISHYPAIGRGKVFLINDVGYATTQLWCHPDMGIEKMKRSQRTKGGNEYRNHRAHLSRYSIAQERRKHTMIFRSSMNSGRSGFLHFQSGTRNRVMGTAQHPPRECCGYGEE